MPTYDFSKIPTTVAVEGMAAELAREDWPRLPGYTLAQMTTEARARLYGMQRAGQLVRVLQQDRGAALTDDPKRFQQTFVQGYTVEFVRLWQETRAATGKDKGHA